MIVKPISAAIEDSKKRKKEKKLLRLLHSFCPPFTNLQPPPSLPTTFIKNTNDPVSFKLFPATSKITSGTHDQR